MNQVGYLPGISAGCTDNKTLNILIVFNISNINKEINKEIPEDDIIEDRNMLECFLVF
jgi:hypothetical protein